MPLPDRIDPDDLEALGYEITSPGQAKHKRYRSYRHECCMCLTWVKQTENGRCRICWRRALKLGVLDDWD